MGHHSLQYSLRWSGHHLCSNCSTARYNNLTKIIFVIISLNFAATGRVVDLANGTYLNCTSFTNGTNCKSGLNYDYQVCQVKFRNF